MDIQTNFQIVSDEELSEIVGGGYPNYSPFQLS